jgi:basic amino acid/polyamine antiporter, APA family
MCAFQRLFYITAAGFDVIATSAEEALNPALSVPYVAVLAVLDASFLSSIFPPYRLSADRLGIIGSLGICACCYMGVSAIICLMVPYSSISVTAPLPEAFRANGALWASYIVDIGAVAGCVCPGRKHFFSSVGVN